MEPLTIDELARAAGMTVRNVRSHQTRGLLPKPELRGRVAYYDEQHLERLQLIKELQEDGIALRLIERLLAENPDAATRVVGLRRAVMMRLDAGEPQVVTPQELGERVGAYSDEDLARAVAIGALVPRADGSFSVPRPGILAIAQQVMEQGVSLTAALLVAEQAQAATALAARAFVDMVFEEIWLPFDEAGRPDGDWPKIASAIEQVRPLASQIMLEMLPESINSEIDVVFGQILTGQIDQSPAAD